MGLNGLSGMPVGATVLERTARRGLSPQPRSDHWPGRSARRGRPSASPRRSRSSSEPVHPWAPLFRSWSRLPVKREAERHRLAGQLHRLGHAAASRTRCTSVGPTGWGTAGSMWTNSGMPRLSGLEPPPPAAGT